MGNFHADPVFIANDVTTFAETTKLIKRSQG